VTVAHLNTVRNLPSEKERLATMCNNFRKDNFTVFVKREVGMISTLRV